MNARRWQLTPALVSLLGVFAACEPPANAQNYPARPVKIIVPGVAGGPGDTISRIIAQKLTEASGGQFYIENQPGAAGSIGAGAAANAPKDGYTILIANQDLVIQPIIKAKVPYDPFKSFTAVIEIATAPEMIVVNPSLPVKSMTELFNVAAPRLRVAVQADLRPRCRPRPVPGRGWAGCHFDAGGANTDPAHHPAGGLALHQGGNAPPARGREPRAFTCHSERSNPGRGRRTGSRGRLLDRRPGAERNAHRDRRFAAAPVRRRHYAPRCQGTPGSAWLRSGRRHVPRIRGPHQGGVRQMEKGC